MAEDSQFTQERPTRDPEDGAPSLEPFRMFYLKLSEVDMALYDTAKPTERADWINYGMRPPRRR